MTEMTPAFGSDPNDYDPVHPPTAADYDPLDPHRNDGPDQAMAEIRSRYGTDQRIVIVGGCGRVGLPLGVAFASRGRDVLLYDTDRRAVDHVNAGHLPFAEAGTVNLDHATGTLHATSDPTRIRDADVVIITIGTPIDDHLNPDPMAVPAAVKRLLPCLRDGQMLVLRSTCYPGTAALVEGVVAMRRVDVVVAPERIAEGRAMVELFELPQIIGARMPAAADRAAALFAALNGDHVHVTPEEAELAKLFTNAWRYITFAAANQLYMLATNAHVDYARVRAAVVHNYPRAAGLPGAGFAAGPCLAKDTLTLAAFADNTFGLGHAALLVNEGLPLYLATRIDQRYGLATLVVGILGMSFKANSDDTRDSLSFKLRKVLTPRALDVMCADARVDDPRLHTLDEVLAHADLLIIGVPHDEYRDLKTDLPVVDLWGITGRGIQL